MYRTFLILSEGTYTHIRRLPRVDTKMLVVVIPTHHGTGHPGVLSISTQALAPNAREHPFCLYILISCLKPKESKISGLERLSSHFIQFTTAFKIFMSFTYHLSNLTRCLCINPLLLLLRPDVTPNIFFEHIL